MKLRLVRTCGACPEQYEVYLGEKWVGYMRLRHRYFYAEYLDEKVYEAYPDGDGIFDSEEERHEHLQAASLAILAKISNPTDKAYTIEEL